MPTESEVKAARETQYVIQCSADIQLAAAYLCRADATQNDCSSAPWRAEYERVCARIASTMDAIDLANPMPR